MATMAPAHVLRNFKVWLSVFAGAMITALYTGSSVGYVSNNSVLAQSSDQGQTSKLIEVTGSFEMEKTSQDPTTYRRSAETPNNETINTTARRHDKILCWIVTHPGNLFKAKVVQETWGRKCDKLIFISSKNETSLPTAVFPIQGQESRKQLWNKAKFTFQHVYDNYLNDYDWFFKADDDTYAIMENLRSYVATLNSSLPLFLGRRFKRVVGKGKQISYLTGGPGYLMTRETLRRLVERGLKKKECVAYLPGNSDDIILGICMEQLGAMFEDTRDEDGLQRFTQHFPEDEYNSTSGSFGTLQKYDYYPPATGYNCCSNHLISFHYASGHKAQFMEYLMYKLKISNDTDSSPN